MIRLFLGSIAAMALFFAPSILVAATGDISRQLDPASAADLVVMLSALVLPALGGILLLNAVRPSTRTPQQLRDALATLKMLED